MGPPNGPALARSGSTWIHWWSPVASANWLTCSCVTRCHSLGGSGLPIFSRSPSMPFTVTVMDKNLGDGPSVWPMATPVHELDLPEVDLFGLEREEAVATLLAAQK